MTSAQEKGISVERVQESSSTNIEYLDCSICRDILWKPVACQSCETPFCLSCIDQWLGKNATHCPFQCEKYIERKCPPFIVKLLAQLKISCFYRSNGCEQILPYEALDKHEIECDYQPKQCPGCESNMLKKDFVTHETTCDLIKITCEDCKLVYKRSEGNEEHTEIICLKKQIKRLENVCTENTQKIEKFNSELMELKELRLQSKQKTIIFEKLPVAIHENLLVPNRYQGLIWNQIYYVHESFIKGHYPNSGYATSFMPGGSLHVAFFNGEASISVGPLNETFTLVSVTASGAWRDNVLLAMKAYRNSVFVDYCDANLIYGRPQQILLNWKNIDKVVLNSSGGYARVGGGLNIGSHIILSQLVVDNVITMDNNQ